MFGIRSKNNYNQDTSNYIYFLGTKAPVKKYPKLLILYGECASAIDDNINTIQPYALYNISKEVNDNFLLNGDDIKSKEKMVRLHFILQN